MKKRKEKKQRKRLYEDIIEDVALEISLDSRWRALILTKELNEKIEITYHSLEELPCYIKDEIQKYKLKFWVEMVSSSNEYFEEGMVIFKFTSKEYPQVFRYTGNNLDIV